jgi:NDP-sugar pyrophosphorylase family protein
LGAFAPTPGDVAFMLTYCDGVSDVNLDDLLAFHRSHGRLAALTACEKELLEKLWNNGHAPWRIWE